MPDYFTAKNGNLFIQPDGPNTPPVPLGCHDLGDITEPLGDVSQRYYLDANGVYQPILEAQGVPGRVTTSITTYLGTVRDELERIRCPFPLYVNRATCGRKDIFLNYDRGEVLTRSRIGSRSRTNNVSREGADATEQTFEISAASSNQYFPLRLAYQTSVETVRLWDICFIMDYDCAGICGPAPASSWEVGFMCAEAGPGVHAFVYYTLTGGATWTQCAAVPFGHDEDIFCCECFYVTRDTIRVIVGRSVTDAGNPAEIAWSDDFGATWQTVNLGAVNAEFLPWNGSLLALDNRHIWAGTDAGKLWFSEDGGLTWDLSLTVAATDIMDIKFRDEHYGLVVGESGMIYKTIDGGATWVHVVEPAADAGNPILACEIIDNNRMWLGFGNANLYYSNDAGGTWTRRNLSLYPGLASFTAFSAMSFVDEYCGWLAISCLDAPAHIYSVYYRTFNGGADWEYWIATGQLHAVYGPGGIHACDYNKCYFVGDPPGGVALGMVGVISG